MEIAKLLWFYSVNEKPVRLFTTNLFYPIISYMIYLLSLFIWYIPLEPMVVGDLLLVVQLNEGVEHNLEEWIQLGEYQPNIHHPHIRGGWQLGHHTESAIN